MLYIFILLVPLIAWAQVQILSNFPLRRNNLEKVITPKNYKEMVEIIKSIDDVKDVYVMEEEDKVIIYVERFPIVRKIRIVGNRAVSQEEILSYLGMYEGMPLKNVELSEPELKDRVERFYMDRGFLDAKIGVTMESDEEGYVYLYIGIDEGPVYFTEGGVYKGSSFESSLLDLQIGLVKGRVFKESLFRESIFLLQDFYVKEGYWDSFVYYEGVEKIKLNRPFYWVLFPRDKAVSQNPLRWLGFLSEGISNLFSHPIGTFKALIGMGNVARPVFQVIEGKKYEVVFQGISFFTERELMEISHLKEKGADPFSLEEAKKNIVDAYHRKGFFDVKVDYKREGENRIVFIVDEGQRYRVLGEDMDGEFYDEERFEEMLKEKLERLFKEGYTLAEGSIDKDISRDEKVVKVRLNIRAGKRQVLKDLIYEGENREIKKIFSKYREKLPTIFDSRLIEALNLDIQRYFLQRGYMEGDFETNVKVEEDEGNIYYTYIYTVKEGPVYRLGETVYYGYDKTTSRELSYMTEKGVSYSEDLNDRTINNMLNSGIFTGVRIDTFVDRDKKVVHRLIQLSEDKRGLLDISLGYNTEEKLSLDLFLGMKNLFGVGLSAGIKYRKTGKRELYDIGLEDRFLFSSRYWFRTDVFKNYEEHKSYSLDSKGVNLQLGYRIGSHTSVGPILSLLHNKVDGQFINVKKYGLFLLREFKDDVFSPNRIHYNSINISVANGDTRYTKLDISTFYMIPIVRDVKLSFKVAGGVVEGGAPIFERFFLGGFKDLRGYSFEEIGQPNGGKYYAFGRMELLFPLKGSLIGVVFGDVGKVGQRMKEVFKGLKGDMGFATGFNTPIGPVRLDLAFPLEHGWHKKYKLYLSVGYYY